MFINLSLLRKNRNFRLLYLGQFVSFFGTMISITVVPFQVYSLTQSSAMVGWVSAVELVPMVIASLIGGALADHLDRRKLLIICEILMALGIGTLMINSSLAHPSLALIFVVAAIIQAVNGFHRPAMDSLGQALLSSEEIPTAAALQSFKFGVALLLGPSMGGLLASSLGIQFAYAFDFATFFFSILMLWFLKTNHLIRETKTLHLASSLLDGLKYAAKRQEIMGTYIVDLVAMTFAFPFALFPAVSLAWGHPERIGMLYSALAVGGLLVPLLSGRAARVKRQGQVIIVAAALWGLGIALFGLSNNFWVALGFLAFAGIADTVSGLYRSIIWNQTIPNEIRGRMAGLEMISFMSGPLMGNARAGWVASASSTSFSLISGGLMCIFFVLLAGFFLPGFRNYLARVDQN